VLIYVRPAPTSNSDVQATPHPEAILGKNYAVHLKAPSCLHVGEGVTAFFALKLILCLYSEEVCTQPHSRLEVRQHPPPLAPRPLFPTNPHSSASWHCCCSGRCVGARGRRPGPSLQPRPGNEIPTPQPAKGQPAAFSPSRGPFSGPPPSGEDITGFWSMIQPSTPAALSTAHTEELGGEAVVGGGVVEERCGHHREQRPRGGGGIHHMVLDRR